MTPFTSSDVICTRNYTSLAPRMCGFPFIASAATATVSAPAIAVPARTSVHLATLNAEATATADGHHTAAAAAPSVASNATVSVTCGTQDLCHRQPQGCLSTGTSVTSSPSRPG